MLPDDDPRHGTPNGYNNLGCRCPECREAQRIAMNKYMHADPQRLVRHRDRMRARRARTKGDST